MHLSCTHYYLALILALTSYTSFSSELLKKRYNQLAHEAAVKGHYTTLEFLITNKCILPKTHPELLLKAAENYYDKDNSSSSLTLEQYPLFDALGHRISCDGTHYMRTIALLCVHKWQQHLVYSSTENNVLHILINRILLSEKKESSFLGFLDPIVINDNILITLDILLKSGARVTQKNKAQETPLSLAKKLTTFAYKNDVIKLLEEVAAKQALQKNTPDLLTFD